MFDCNRCALVGMVHTLPLPGSPNWGGDMGAVVRAALSDAEALAAGGCDALVVENMNDLPYLRGSVYPETVAAMAVVCQAVAAVGLPFGVQILAGANAQALAVAATTGGGFVRVEGFAYGHLADEGWMDACAGPLLRKRAQLGVNVAVWADVQKKHAAHAMTADLSLTELCEGAVFSGADVLVITGRATGLATDLSEVEAAKGAGRPVVVGSGVTPDNIEPLARCADALIVGSFFKQNGDWRNRVDKTRVTTLSARL
jgi:membrane complex biogenesis BtpA family protein